jgi:DNA-binding Lrp family transcriptional regulator
VSAKLHNVIHSAHICSNRNHEEVFEKIRQIPEMFECHHISSKYSRLEKVLTRNNEHLKRIIVEKIQSIPEITYTESFISLELGFERQIPVFKALMLANTIIRKSLLYYQADTL